jgi:hypothetical protein
VAGFVEIKNSLQERSSSTVLMTNSNGQSVACGKTIC